MNGFMRRALLAASAAGAVVSTGCFTGEHYRNFVDPCYPERYNAVARQEVVGAFGPQVQNGHILSQTVWNYHFDSGTARLNLGGMEKLDQLVRRRPEPDPRIFLATARDIQYSVDEPDKYSDTRRDLDGQRVVAIQKYLAAQTVGRPFPFEVLVHDPVDPAMHAVPASRAVLLQRLAYSGTIFGGGGGGVIGGAIGGGAAQGQAPAGGAGAGPGAGGNPSLNQPGGPGNYPTPQRQ